MRNQHISFFEKALSDHLKKIIPSNTHTKVTKNKIVISANQNSATFGQIGLQYLTKASGYMLSATAKNGDMVDFYKQNPPPYKSNTPPEWQYAMNSLMEKHKVFAKVIGGTVPLPISDADINSTCEWISDKLNNIYIPRISNIVNCTEDLISDIIENPDYYDYPIPMIAYAIKKNGIDPQDKMEKIFTKKLIKNKEFDKNIYINCTSI